MPRRRRGVIGLVKFCLCIGVEGGNSWDLSEDFITEVRLD